MATVSIQSVPSLSSVVGGGYGQASWSSLGSSAGVQAFGPGQQGPSVTLSQTGLQVGGACGVAAVRSVARAQPLAYAPCFQYHVNATPSLFMLADTPCNVAQVCGGRAYRSYAMANQYGLNSYASKGLAVSSACTKTIAVAPVSASECLCDGPWA